MDALRKHREGSGLALTRACAHAYEATRAVLRGSQGYGMGQVSIQGTRSDEHPSRRGVHPRGDPAFRSNEIMDGTFAALLGAASTERILDRAEIEPAFARFVGEEPVRVD
ncbi:hypothetical protein GCM10010910_28640 [Microbacterium nanhaiense]|uniref:Uncharacterized protein n=1 Tax=Microbacterium nanhaiense TaxID=1301026 RepID=A0ABQ2N3Y9_9MICO|nr:hypothetical protein GCM10010910_28640 [Microbacterium nanhaiense]